MLTGIDIEGEDFSWSSDINELGKSIVITEGAGKTIICQDMFATKKLYFCTVNRRLKLSSSIAALIDSLSIKFEKDIVGLNELLSFGNCIWTRTSVKNIKQIPFCGRVQVDHQSGTVDYIESYYNELDMNRGKDFSYDEYLDELHSIFLRIFKTKLLKDRKYCLGLSGGLDSRLTYAYATLFIEKDNLQTYTFGYNEFSDEFKIAKLITDVAGNPKPIFFKLTDENYQNSLEYLPKMSHGMISSFHGHITEVARSSVAFSSCININTYLSDALFGYATPPEKQNKDFNQLSLHSENVVADIKDEYRDDLKQLYNHLPKSSNFRSLSEEIYVFERTSKFHMTLAEIQEVFFNGQTLIYNDLELIKFFITLPSEYRYNKKIINDLLEKYFGAYASDKIQTLSSLDFRARSEFATNGDVYFTRFIYLYFRMLNLLNLVFRYCTLGRLRIKSRFQTEELENVFTRKFFWSYLRQRTSKKLDRRIKETMKHQKVSFFSLRSTNISKALQFISFMVFFDD